MEVSEEPPTEENGNIQNSCGESGSQESENHVSFPSQRHSLVGVVQDTAEAETSPHESNTDVNDCDVAETDSSDAGVQDEALNPITQLSNVSHAEEDSVQPVQPQLARSYSSVTTHISTEKCRPSDQKCQLAENATDECISPNDMSAAHQSVPAQALDSSAPACIQPEAPPSNNNYEIEPVNSSYSTIVLRLPVFGVANTESIDSAKNSDTGTENTEESAEKEPSDVHIQERRSCHSFLHRFSPSLPPDNLWRHSSVLIESEQTRRVRRRVTASAQEELVNYWNNPQMPQYVHLRHSYPSLQVSSPWIYDESALDALNHMRSSSTIPENGISNTSTAGTNGSAHSSTSSSLDSSASDASTQPLISSSAQFGAQEEDLTEYMFQPVPSIALDYVHHDVGAPPEHPFPAPANGIRPAIGAVMAYINTTPPVRSPSRSRPRSSQARRSHGFTRPASVPSSSHQESSASFMRTMRSELFHNITNVGPSEADLGWAVSESDISEANEVLEVASSGFLNDGVEESHEQLEETSSSDDSLSDSSDTDSSTTTEEDVDLNDGDDLEDDEVPADDDESVDSNMGDGDAVNDVLDVMSDSSHTSIGSGPDPGPPLPRWFIPSAVGGGKYDYFQVTQRPRPFRGHKFVVSEFGTQARRNQTSLPWVPTRADRLRYILNQYLQENAPMQSVETQTDPVDDSVLDNLEEDSDAWGCVKPKKTAKSAPKDRKLNKAVSWSLDPAQRRGSEDDQVNCNSNSTNQGDFVERSIPSSQSCPGMLMSGDREGDEGDQAAAACLPEAAVQGAADLETPKPPHDSEPIPLDVALKTDKPSATKKRPRCLLRVFVRGCCRARSSGSELDHPGPKSQIKDL